MKTQQGFASLALVLMTAVTAGAMYLAFTTYQQAQQPIASPVASVPEINTTQDVEAAAAELSQMSLEDPTLGAEELEAGLEEL